MVVFCFDGESSVPHCPNSNPLRAIGGQTEHEPAPHPPPRTRKQTRCAPLPLPPPLRLPSAKSRTRTQLRANTGAAIMPPVRRESDHGRGVFREPVCVKVCGIMWKCVHLVPHTHSTSCALFVSSWRLSIYNLDGETQTDKEKVRTPIKCKGETCSRK